VNFQCTKKYNSKLWKFLFQYCDISWIFDLNHVNSNKHKYISKSVALSTHHIGFKSFKSMMNNNTITIKMQKGRRHFTEEEDAQLKYLVYGLGEHWNKIAAFITGRTARQCKDRYNTYLKPYVSHSPWTKEEDDTLIDLYNQYGSKWTKISTYLPGRSDNNVKNRWYKHISKRIILPTQEQVEKKNCSIEISQNLVEKSNLFEFDDSINYDIISFL